jgi:hypothetical protein
VGLGDARCKNVEQPWVTHVARRFTEGISEVVIPLLLPLRLFFSFSFSRLTARQIFIHPPLAPSSLVRHYIHTTSHTNSPSSDILAKLVFTLWKTIAWRRSNMQFKQVVISLLTMVALLSTSAAACAGTGEQPEYNDCVDCCHSNGCECSGPATNRVCICN